jgi:indolepyruvate ferredoxin oxidoreductase beta subunit
MSTNVILCGVGGQGTVLASKLMATAAMDADMPVKTAETIGMAQRGGSVFSHVRIGEGAPTSLVGPGRADLILAFEPAEAVRQLPYLKSDGTVVVSNRPIVPVSASTGGPAYDLEALLGYLEAHVEHLVVVDAVAAAADLGSAKCLNVVLLGAAARSGALGLTPAAVEQAVRELVPPKYLDLNIRALAYTA